jgi:hypothetical protein
MQVVAAEQNLLAPVAEMAERAAAETAVRIHVRQMIELQHPEQ